MAKLFADAGLDGAVIGGVARNHWAIPRLTFDLDFTVVADAAAEHALITGMLQAGFEIVREQRPQAPSGPDFVQLYNRTTQHVVEFQAAKTEYQGLLLQRALPFEGAPPLKVVTREDLIVLKLIAFRDKDLDDLRQVGRSPGLDWEYISHWADIWQATERLSQLRTWLA